MDVQALSAAYIAIKAGIISLTWNLTSLVVLTPARHLFLQGPALLGCWQGSPLEDVCAGLTGSPSKFWAGSEDTRRECNDIVDRQVFSFLVVIYVVMYFSALGLVFWRLAKKITSSFINIIK